MSKSKWYVKSIVIGDTEDKSISVLLNNPKVTMDDLPRTIRCAFEGVEPENIVNIAPRN